MIHTFFLNHACRRERAVSLWVGMNGQTGGSLSNIFSTCAHISNVDWKESGAIWENGLQVVSITPQCLHVHASKVRDAN